MPSPRTCTHVKINGVKCGSPALKYHTHCYFHYKWLNRRANPYHFDRKEGWTTMTLPPLESKASILFAISEIQASLLQGSIDFKTAKALFYGIQLAIQLKATADELGARETPDTCHELTEELNKARCAHRRPPQVICNSCERADTCTSTDNCLHSTEQIRELERIHEPERYARQLKDEEYERELQKRSQELWDQKMAEAAAYQQEHTRKLALQSPRPTPCHPERSEGSATSPTSTTSVPSPSPDRCHPERSEGPTSFPTTTTNPNPTSTPCHPAAEKSTALHPCHPERSAVVPREAEGPFVSSTPAVAPTPSAPPVTTPTPTPCHPERSEGPTSFSATTTNPTPSSTPCHPERSEGSASSPTSTTPNSRKLFRSPGQFARLESRALNEINILRSNS